MIWLTNLTMDACPGHVREPPLPRVSSGATSIRLFWIKRSSSADLPCAGLIARTSAAGEKRQAHPLAGNQTQDIQQRNSNGSFTATSRTFFPGTAGWHCAGRPPGGSPRIASLSTAFKSPLPHASSKFGQRLQVKARSARPCSMTGGRWKTASRPWRPG